MTASPAALAVEHAEKIAALLRDRGIQSALIGGAALAAYSYVRATDDIDLGTSVDVWTKLRDATEALNSAAAKTRADPAEDSRPGLFRGGGTIRECPRHGLPSLCRSRRLIGRDRSGRCRACRAFGEGERARD